MVRAVRRPCPGRPDEPAGTRGGRAYLWRPRRRPSHLGLRADPQRGTPDRAAGYGPPLLRNADACGPLNPGAFAPRPYQPSQSAIPKD